MADDEIWSTGDAQSDPADPTFGEADYEEGLHPNSAFAIDSVFRYGTAVLQEQPQMAILGGVNFFVLAMLAAGVSFGVNMGLIGMGASGQIDQDVVDVLSNLTGLFIQLVAWPVNQLVLAGLMVGGALWVREGTASVGALYTSVRAAVRGLLAGLAAGVASLVAVGLAMAPSLVVGGLLAGAAGEVEMGVIVGLLLMIPAMFALVYVSLGLLLAPYAAVLDHLGPIEAVQRSWAAADGARVTLFVTNLVFGILGGISSCFCSIPLIVVIPIQIMGFTAAYLRYSRHTDVTASWEFFERNP